MKVRTYELQGAALDWAVAKCWWVYKGIGSPEYFEREDFVWEGGFTPSTDWAQGGPIIEHERISFRYENLDGTGECLAYYLSTMFEKEKGWQQTGSTPLIAAMRCYVASKLGEGALNEIEIPEEIYETVL